MLDLLGTELNKDEIEYRRKQISQQITEKSGCLKSSTISRMSEHDLELLFGLYDTAFLNNWFRDSFKGKIRFSLSKRMTKSAGLTLCPKNIAGLKPEDLVIEIRIGVDFFFHYDQVGGSKMVCGLKTENALEALQLVFEHELCHVLEFIHYKKSSCKGKRFKLIAKNLFGHKESYHKLPTQRQIAVHNLGIKIGDVVSFSFKGQKLTGILYNINKRATVMVRNNKGALVDSKGVRYSRYYVPLTLLD